MHEMVIKQELNRLPDDNVQHLIIFLIVFYLKRLLQKYVLDYK